jgi:quinol monooxygenase YgiN
MGGHNMPEVWTHGRWTVVSGKEDDFVRAWRDMATWTRSQFPTATGTLLRDRDQPNVFFSFGSWPNLETVGQWRGSEGFQQYIATIRELLESFESHTLDPVVQPE